MAGDWIKMRSNLWDDPRVGALMDATDSGEAAVVGGLYWLWATADQHTEDGCMPGLTLRQIDRKTGVAGLGAALCQVGWLRETPEGVVIAKFEEHNGTSAKRRCTEAQRKANSRNLSASDADNTGTEGGKGTDEKRRSAELEREKRRDASPDGDGKPAASVDKGRYPEEFEAAWQLYPSRPGNSKADAHKAWATRVKAGVQPAALADGVRRYAAFCVANGTEPQFIKQAATFFGPGEHFSNDWKAPATRTPAAKPSAHAGLADRNYSQGVFDDGTFV